MTVGLVATTWHSSACHSVREIRYTTALPTATRLRHFEREVVELLHAAPHATSRCCLPEQFATHDAAESGSRLEPCIRFT